jgi:hypothetical protein
MLNPEVKLIEKPEPVSEVEKQVENENVYLNWRKQ